MKMNINDFSYNKKPMSKVRQFGILTLSDEGVHEYVDRNSYTHTFLFNRHIGRINNQLENNYTVSSIKEENKEPAVHENKIENSANEEKSDHQETIKRHPNIFKEKQKIENLLNYNETESSTTSRNIKRKDKKFLTQNINSVKNSMRRKFIDTDNRYNTDYLTSLNILKTHYCSTEPGLNYQNRTLPLGFKSTDVPRLDSLKPREPSTQYKVIHKKLNRCIESAAGSIENQNSNIKTILNDKIRLPELNQLKQINIQKKITNNKVGTPFNKYMGEKYNPHNFNYNFQKTTTRRNVFGSLFQH